MNKAILSLMATTILVACGNTGGRDTGNGGVGGVPAASGTSLLSTNTYSQDKLKKKQTIYIDGNRTNDEFSFDPETKTFVHTMREKVKGGDEWVIDAVYKGIYDPETGLLTVKTCEGTSIYCKNAVDGQPAPPFNFRYIEDGYVILKESTGHFGTTNPTAVDKMPANVALSYTGHAVLYYGILDPDIYYSDEYASDEGLTRHVSLIGTATSEVDFGSGLVNVSLTDMNGDGVSGVTATINGIKINGNQLIGDRTTAVTITSPDGLDFVPSHNSVSGTFFGEDASSLGGHIDTDFAANPDSDVEVSLFGSWSGVLQ